MSDWTSTDFALPGDANLDALSGFPTYDAAVLEFDFIPTANQVVFNYAFASDEYPEWVSTPYNDVFAFYVNGTNYADVRQIAGDPAAPFVPVAVNNINNSNPVLTPPPTPMRPDLFRTNYYNPAGPSAIDLELDGITSVLTFQAPVNPGVVNHMKLAIADASDGIYDSAVFIKAGSLVSNENPVADLSVMPSSGSAPLLVTAIVEGEDPNGLPLTYSINWGDGTPATDPLPLDQTVLVDHVYTAAGTYFMTLTVSNGALSGTSTEDIDVLGVNVPPVVTSNPTDQTVFDGDLFTFSASALGMPAPAVQWQVSTDSGATFTDLVGATAPTYSATASLLDSGNLYHAVFTNSEGSAASAAAMLTVMPLDTTPPVAPGVALAQDTGSSSTDKITQVGTLTLSNVETGASVAYSSDNGMSWSADFNATEGLNTVLVHQTDAAGNVSDATSFSFTLDTTSPAALDVALTEDTGSSSTDKLTKVGTLTLNGMEIGASVAYSADNGATWSSNFNAMEGLNAVLVRQTDVAGNVSNITPFSFTLDTTPPALNPTFSSAQPFLVCAVGITVSANATDVSGIASQSTGVVSTSSAGRKLVTCTATDNAGNSASIDVPYLVGYGAIKVLPLAGATFKQGASIPVSFQLVDANGRISDQAAVSLLPNIAVALDGLPSVSAKYNKKTHTFTATLKTSGLLAGTHEISIRVTLGGIDVTTVLIPVNVV